MGDAWMSFGAQALHYFQREHEEVRRTPLGGAAAWRGRELRDRDDWIVHLSAADVAELAAAVALVRRRGLGMGELQRADFPLPTLAPRIRLWIDELRNGRGFLLLRALPVADWGDDDSALAYWGLGQHLGRPGATRRRPTASPSVSAAARRTSDASAARLSPGRNAWQEGAWATRG